MAAYKVSWTRVNQRTYLYGACIDFTEAGVHYTCPLMPSGRVIHAWSSQAAYWSDRGTPDLPLLAPGKAYRIQADYGCQPAGSVMVSLAFYDQWEGLLEELFVSGADHVFTVPATMYAYQVRLMNTSHQSLCFKEIVLSAVDGGPLVEAPDYGAINACLFGPGKKGD